MQNGIITKPRGKQLCSTSHSEMLSQVSEELICRILQTQSLYGFLPFTVKSDNEVIKQHDMLIVAWLMV